eukprot:3473421-Amphidinium_carterae.1
MGTRMSLPDSFFGNINAAGMFVLSISCLSCSLLPLITFCIKGQCCPEGSQSCSSISIPASPGPRVPRLQWAGGALRPQDGQAKGDHQAVDETSLQESVRLKTKTVLLRGDTLLELQVVAHACHYVGAWRSLATGSTVLPLKCDGKPERKRNMCAQRHTHACARAHTHTHARTHARTHAKKWKSVKETQKMRTTRTESGRHPGRDGAIHRPGMGKLLDRSRGMRQQT